MRERAERVRRSPATGTLTDPRSLKIGYPKIEMPEHFEIDDSMILPPLPEGPPNRLTLARWLVAKDHPLMARVTVNRYWTMFFGTGLVKTINDFGSQGEWPSHPELLDWLAVEFRESGAYLGDTTFVNGDVFRVAIEGTRVAFYKNGVRLTSVYSYGYRLERVDR